MPHVLLQAPHQLVDVVVEVVNSAVVDVAVVVVVSMAHAPRAASTTATTAQAAGAQLWLLLSTVQHPAYPRPA